MIIFKKPEHLHSFLSSEKTRGLTTGFVPTMGALHNGHLGLVARALGENDLVICSIFVNPTQFNDAKDFENYPTTIEKDICFLEKAGCSILFLPSVKDIYPNGIDKATKYEMGPLENILEGKFRPGHFQGVCQVVNRLLDIVTPTKLYIGQKDFQQCMVIKKLIELLQIETEIIICPTQREPDGLAMSSRNLRLHDTERKKAPALYQSLLSIKKNLKAGDTTQLKQTANQLLTDAGFKVDYVEIAIADTLEIIQNWDGKIQLVGVAAAYLNDVRLIDNLILNNPVEPGSPQP
ncbi:MAG: pantoate--beta-alanine ligase [Ferruginibacter sp.]